MKTQKALRDLLTKVEQKDMEKVKSCLEGILKNRKYKLQTQGQSWSWRYVNTGEPRGKMN